LPNYFMHVQISKGTAEFGPRNLNFDVGSPKVLLRGVKFLYLFSLNVFNAKLFNSTDIRTKNFIFVLITKVKTTVLA
jgi:hypothetical protein